jgi:hypothetical protein
VVEAGMGGAIAGAGGGAVERRFGGREAVEAEVAFGQGR